MKTKVLKHEAGKYALLEQGGRYYAGVVCGTSAKYVLNIPITAGQARDAIRDESLLERLVGEIAFAPARYAAQHVQLGSQVEAGGRACRSS